MNKDQVNSLIRSLLKIAGAWLVAHGLSEYASLVNSDDVFGLLVLLVGMWQSHQRHAMPVVGLGGPTALLSKVAAAPQAQESKTS
jgi:hypothetical protein